MLLETTHAQPDVHEEGSKVFKLIRSKSPEPRYDNATAHRDASIATILLVS